MTEPSWEEATTGPCPAPDDLLLAAAGELGDLGVPAARAALDDQSRVLFAHADTRVACVTRLTTALELDLGYRVDPGLRPEAFALPQVLATRTGHPLLLAVVAVGLLRRAGHPATVCRAGGRWLAAAEGSPLVVLDLEGGPRPGDVRPVCGHLVGAAVLAGLEGALAREGRPAEAAACEALAAALPTLAR